MAPSKYERTVEGRGDYTEAGIQKQKNARADRLKRYAKDGDYAKASANNQKDASTGPPSADAALQSGVDDYIHRNPNKVSANVRTAPYGSSNEEIVRRTMKANPSSFKHGGMVKKTGFAKVHKGERVLTAKQAGCK